MGSLSMFSCRIRCAPGHRTTTLIAAKFSADVVLAQEGFPNCVAKLFERVPPVYKHRCHIGCGRPNCSSQYRREWCPHTQTHCGQKAVRGSDRPAHSDGLP